MSHAANPDNSQQTHRAADPTSGRTVVIGGGVVGVSTAYYLASRGHDVTLLEQGEIASGCSFGNAGQVTPGHLPLQQPGLMWRNLRWLFSRKAPLYVPPRFDPGLLFWLLRFQRSCTHQHLRHATETLCLLGRASYELYQQLADELDFDWLCLGRLEVCRSEKSLLGVEREAALLQEFGFQTESLSADEVRRREPALTGPIAGAVYLEESGHVDPEKFTRVLADAAAARGAEIRTNTAVTSFVRREGKVAAVCCGDEEIEVSNVVLACGSWLEPAQWLGLKLPIQPGKGYHVDVDLPANAPTTPTILMEEKIFMEPLDDFLRLAGTMEFSGFNFRELPLRLDMLTQGVARYFPDIDMTNIRSKWCHLRPMSCDGLPVISKVPEVDNAWIATGHGMLGQTQGPITGQLLSQWIDEGRTSIDLTAVSAQRFC